MTGSGIDVAEGASFLLYPYSTGVFRLSSADLPCAGNRTNERCGARTEIVGMKQSCATPERSEADESGSNGVSLVWP